MKAVLLDVDGTLVDSNDLHVEAWREAFRRYGKEIPKDVMHAQMGKGGDQIVELFLDEDERRRFGKAVDALHVELFVRKYQPRVVLASSAKDQEMKGHLAVLGIDDLLDHRTSGDDAEHSKPCPDIFQAALGDLEPEDAVVIGDSPYDAQAARKAGIPMLGVLTGGFSEQTLRENGAREVYRDLDDLLRRWT
jgi:HAD superfamily hydrolase (TIGR01549 family)